MPRLFYDTLYDTMVRTDISLHVGADGIYDTIFHARFYHTTGAYNPRHRGPTSFMIPMARYFYDRFYDTTGVHNS